MSGVKSRTEPGPGLFRRVVSKRSLGRLLSYPGRCRTSVLVHTHTLQPTETGRRDEDRRGEINDEDAAGCCAHPREGPWIAREQPRLRLLPRPSASNEGDFLCRCFAFQPDGTAEAMASGLVGQEKAREVYPPTILFAIASSFIARFIARFIAHFSDRRPGSLWR